MKKTDPVLTLELSSNTKTHIVNANLQRFVIDAKRLIQKKDIVITVTEK